MLTCEACHGETKRLVIRDGQLQCDVCAYGVRSANASAGVIDDTIIGGFWQENFGHAPEYFDSKQKMARRAKELRLEPFVRHKDGDKHTSRWF